jgi:hypothetical protein
VLQKAKSSTTREKKVETFFCQIVRCNSVTAQGNRQKQQQQQQQQEKQKPRNANNVYPAPSAYANRAICSSNVGGSDYAIKKKVHHDRNQSINQSTNESEA